MSGFKEVRLRLPAELVTKIDTKASSEGMTRQQLLAALVDLGFERRAVSGNGTLGPQKVIQLLRSVEASDTAWSYRQFRSALYEHLIAMVGK